MLDHRNGVVMVGFFNASQAVPFLWHQRHHVHGNFKNQHQSPWSFRLDHFHVCHFILPGL